MSMSKNILNEELNQMKYLFGYKAGKVISEQTQPTPQTSAQGNPLVKVIYDMVMNKTPYLYSNLAPGKILTIPSITLGDNGLELRYTQVAPSDGVVAGTNEIFRITDGNKVVKSMEELSNLIKDNRAFLSKIEGFSEIPTRPLSTLDIMYLVGGEKNPQAFVEFLQKNFGEKAKQTLMDQIQKRANSTTQEYNPTPAEARILFQKLNPKQQTQTTPTK